MSVKQISGKIVVISPRDGDLVTSLARTKLDGTRQLKFSGDMDLQTNKIVNLTDPTANQEAATKAYVDAGGGGGSAGGSNTHVQYNNAGSFGGGAGFVFDGSGNVTATDGIEIDRIGICGQNSNEIRTNNNISLQNMVINPINANGVVINSTEHFSTDGTGQGSISVVSDTDDGGSFAYDMSATARIKLSKAINQCFKGNSSVSIWFKFSGNLASGDPDTTFIGPEDNGSGVEWFGALRTNSTRFFQTLADDGVRSGSASVSDNPRSDDGSWHNVVYTREYDPDSTPFVPKNEIKVYVDGTLKGTAPLSHSDPIDTTEFHYIGWSNFDGYAGDLASVSLYFDDIRVFDRLLTTSEISSLASSRDAAGIGDECLWISATASNNVNPYADQSGRAFRDNYLLMHGTDAQPAGEGRIGQHLTSSGNLDGTNNVYQTLYLTSHKRQLSGDATSEIFPGGKYKSFELPVDGHALFEYLIVGTTDDGTNQKRNAFRYTGLVDNNGGVGTFVGSPSKSTIASGSPDLNVNVTLSNNFPSDGSVSLSLKGIHATGSTTNWCAKMTAVEVRWPNGGEVAPPPAP